MTPRVEIHKHIIEDSFSTAGTYNAEMRLNYNIGTAVTHVQSEI